MTYTYSVATSIGKVRLLIGDKGTTAAAATFADEELQVFLDACTDNVYSAAAQALRAWAAALSRDETDVTLGAWRGKLDPVGQMLALAEALETKSPRTPYFGQARIDWTWVDEANRELQEGS